ncbi:phenylacetaldehyde reductase-like, partial [Syzygium oleosum]|uniref:phenylacetaldehyde reductase-like n=1 Tax=Syzygium oleosum TaxID=219896 RepID=UPI0024B899BD
TVIVLASPTDDPKKTEHLLALDRAKERLQLFKANLLEEGSFDPIVEGCAGVFHTASPFYHDVKDPQAELLDPAVKGTLNVLKSCSKTPSVQRVVLTSSMAAVEHDGTPLTPNVEVDEDWFSDPDLCRKNKMWYELSKTLAEEAACEFLRKKGIDMVTINPGMVIGPLLQPTLNTSVAAIVNLINGAPTFPDESCGWVNVKDVAKAHILAFVVPSARRRYCLVECVPHYYEIVRFFRVLYPSLQLPEKCEDDKPYMPIYWVSTKKANRLGIEYIDTGQCLKETVESLKEKGFVKF